MVSPGAIAFSLFGVEVAWYGILIGAGFLISSFLAYKRCPLHGIDQDHFLTLLIWLIPSAIVGARAYYVIFEWHYYKDHLNQIFNVRGGGLAIHGGLILCFIVAFFVLRHLKENVLSTFDMCIACVPLAQAIGRWGNFFNEEAHGQITDLPWAQVINGVGYQPTFLYESIWCALLFVFLIWFDTKKRKYDGQVLSLYMILYSVERFFVEGMRTDSLYIGTLRQAQVLSIVVVIGGIALWIITARKYKISLAEQKSDKFTEEKAEESENK